MSISNWRREKFSLHTYLRWLRIRADNGGWWVNGGAFAQAFPSLYTKKVSHGIAALGRCS